MELSFAIIIDPFGGRYCRWKLCSIKTFRTELATATEKIIVKIIERNLSENYVESNYWRWFEVVTGFMIIRFDSIIFFIQEVQQ